MYRSPFVLWLVCGDNRRQMIGWNLIIVGVCTTRLKIKNCSKHCWFWVYWLNWLLPSTFAPNVYKVLRGITVKPLNMAFYNFDSKVMGSRKTGENGFVFFIISMYKDTYIYAYTCTHIHISTITHIPPPTLPASMALIIRSVFFLDSLPFLFSILNKLSRCAASSM